MTAPNTPQLPRGDPVRLHRVLEPRGVLPHAAVRLDTRPELWAAEVRIRVALRDEQLALVKDERGADVNNLPWAGGHGRLRYRPMLL